MKALIVIFSLFLFSTTHVAAETSTQQLTTCISDSTNEKDKKRLAIWAFTAMSNYPEIKDISSIADQTKMESEITIGALLNRLLAKDCVSEVEAASKGGNTVKAVTVAFQHLGRLAIQELMSDQNVGEAMNRPGQYIDATKLKFEN